MITIPRVDFDEHAETNVSTTPRWLILGAIGLITLASGIAVGFIFGHSQGRLDDKKELLEAKSTSQLISEKLRAAESNTAKVQSERDNLKSEINVVTQDRDVKLSLAKQREEAALTRAKEAEQKLAVFAAAETMAAERQREEERQKADSSKRLESIQVSTVKQALMIHENPKDYVGKKVFIPKEIAFIIGDDFRRNTKSGGYLFSWKCGLTASGAEDFGNHFGLQDAKLNYWCDTDSGILAKEKLKAERRGDNILYHRIGLTLVIKTKKVEEFGREREYYFAELVEIE